MSSLTRKDSGLPVLEIPQLPDVFSRLMPSQTPELTFDKGILKGTIHKWKLKRMADVSGHEATIAENRCRVTTATSIALETAIMFGPRIQLGMRKIDFETRMMDLAEKKEEAIVAQEVYKAKTMEIDYEDTKFNYETKLKEMKNAIQDDDR
jgi:hypothetical protein